jgi:hypothetical protein
MEDQNPLKKYLDEEGRVTRWPGHKFSADRKLIVAYLAEKFETGREYTEREVNDILNRHHTFEDWALLRRELYEQGYMNRAKDGTRYWRTPDVKLY